MGNKASSGPGIQKNLQYCRIGQELEASDIDLEWDSV